MAFLTRKAAAAGLALASALALGGCYDDGYGYGGVSAGYGYYDDGYYGGGPYGYYGGPGYGWYDGFYYPGSGYYVYDRGGGRHRWNDDHRRYWEGRRGQADNRPGDGRWNGRPDRPGEGQWSGRPDRPRDGRWQGRPDRPATAQPGTSPAIPGRGWSRPDAGARADRDASRASRGQGVWGAFPRAERAKPATPRAQQSLRNWGGGRSARGERPR